MQLVFPRQKNYLAGLPPQSIQTILVWPNQNLNVTTYGFYIFSFFQALSTMHVPETTLRKEISKPEFSSNCSLLQISTSRTTPKTNLQSLLNTDQV